MSAQSAAEATAVALIIVAVLMIFFAWALRSRRSAAPAVTFAIALFYAYGPAHDSLMRLVADPQVPSSLAAFAGVLSHHVLLTLVALALCAVAAMLIKRRVAFDSPRLVSACNVAAMTLALILVSRLVAATWQDRARMVDRVSANTMSGADAMAGTKMSVLGYNPDIYYIILDGYARADVLRQYYNFDNGPFIAELAQRGFQVNDHSETNYYWTFLSLASSLNYDYLQNFAAPILADRRATNGRDGFGQVARAVQDNRAAHFLRARGYRFVHLLSSSPETMRNPFADEQVGCAGRLFDNEYFRAVAEASWLQALGTVAVTDLAECHQLRLKALADQARQPGPKFVFAHFLPPHHPYLFDRDGNVLRHVTISNQFDFQAKLWEDHEAYLEQVRYMNRAILEVIDRIVAESARPPVIIVQSDHGPNLVDGLTQLQSEQIRLANFAAYLLPQKQTGVLPRNCAPVNQFRYLFNHYFDAQLAILPNKSYYSAFRTPLQLREVAASSLQTPLEKEQ